MKNRKIIPEPSLRRLPVYYNYLKSFSHPENKFISCTDIAEALNLNPIQVRKDIAYTEIIGKPKTGYRISELMETINNFLGWDHSKEAFLIGAGHLGTALLGYEGFKKNGLNIIAAFDNNPEKIGKIVFDKKIFSIQKLPELIKRMKIKICIIAIPPEHAQEVVDIAVKSGIEGFWNFSSTILEVPENVIVQNENLAASLAILTSKLKSRTK